ncbi:MAG: hypothetical protein AAGK14_02260 [Verrucomicrobiota bacterium]
MAPRKLSVQDQVKGLILALVAFVALGGTAAWLLPEGSFKVWLILLIVGSLFAVVMDFVVASLTKGLRLALKTCVRIFRGGR